MKKATITFQCRMTSAGFFSAYKGSMLRGSLGTFLKKTCCTLRLSSCEDCILASRCAFPMLFLGKTTLHGNAPLSLSPPYSLTVTDTGKTSYAPGELFTFGITLFSYAVAYLPYFVHAISLAGKSGMGKHTGNTPGTFDIEEILYQGHSIFHKEERRIDIPQGEDLLLPCWDSSVSGFGELLVYLQTPCRFKADNHFSAALPFRFLFNLIVRRLRSLWALDNENVCYEDFSTMLDRADKIYTLETCLFWKDWTRYSSRQKSSMQLGGLQGSVRYRGDLTAFLPFLSLAKELHIGKQTSFGLGCIDFEWFSDGKDTRGSLR